jgi:hypothetical protein
MERLEAQVCALEAAARLPDGEQKRLLARSTLRELTSDPRHARCAGLSAGLQLDEVEIDSMCLVSETDEPSAVVDALKAVEGLAC